jgi:hypothetical protein
MQVMKASSPWTVEQSEARLTLPDFDARVILNNPSRGLAHVNVRRRAFDGNVLTVLTPGPKANFQDAYARVGDLVATYTESPGWPFRVQIYWRDLTPEYRGAIAAIELIASIQTDLLDTQPELFAASEFQAADVALCCIDPHKGALTSAAPPTEVPQGASAGCFLARSRSGGATYAELIHPADFRGTHIERSGDGATVLKHKLFAERLEKGVILRARVLGLFIDAAGDLDIASAAYRRFCEAAPPLTT